MTVMRKSTADMAAIRHEPDDLVRLFDGTFSTTENTVLRRGGDEPLYLPAVSPDQPHRILFAHGFFASALHEIAHWCIAGRRRRQLVDYGYWYQPDDRDEPTQALFEAVERRPQAIEWAFSDAAGFRFRVSVDNLSGAPVNIDAFTALVAAERKRLDRRGFPPRAERFLAVLRRFYQRAIEARR